MAFTTGARLGSGVVPTAIRAGGGIKLLHAPLRVARSIMSDVTPRLCSFQSSDQKCRYGTMDRRFRVFPNHLYVTACI
jgi:hypothetical protein